MNMKFSIEDVIRGKDLEFEYREGLVADVRNRIIADDELMVQIRESVATELGEHSEQLEQWVFLKIDELSDEAVDSIKLYVEFEFDIGKNL